MLAQTRAEARARGDRHYFTGKQCKHGHACHRLVSNGACLECNKAQLCAKYRADPEKGRAKLRARRESEPERFREYQRSWRAANAETAREWDRKRYAADPQKRRAYVYSWRAANPEYGPQYLSEWQKANPEKVRVYTARRRARHLAAEGSHTADDIKRIFKAQRGRCAHPWCRVKLGERYHVDHIIALSTGGTNWPDNLQILCAPCNHSKSAKHPIDHARLHGMLL